MSKPYQVVFIDAKNKKAEKRTVTDLKDLQEMVEGYIEFVRHPVCSLGVNEDGRMKNFPYGFFLDGVRFIGNGVVANPNIETSIKDGVLDSLKIEFF